MKTTLYTLGLIIILATNLNAQTSYLDSTFGTNGYTITDIDSGFTDWVSNSIVQNDGKIILVGGTKNSSWRNHVSLVRYNTDGSLDTSFGHGGIVETAIQMEMGIGYYGTHSIGIAQQNDGKLLVGKGLFTFSMVRLNVDGSLDTNFGINGMVNTKYGSSSRANIGAIEILPSGKILAIGVQRWCMMGWGGCGGRLGMIRYHANGLIDTTFSNKGFFTQNVSSYFGHVVDVAVQNDSKILIAGNYGYASGPGGTMAQSLIRVDTNGVVDTTFNYNTTWYTEGYALDVLSNGKIIYAGNAGINILTLINEDGSIDKSFGNNGYKNIGSWSWFDDRLDVKIIEDDKILVAGTKRTGWGLSGSQILLALLDTLGNIDSICAPGIVYGAGTGTTLQIQNDGKIIVGGWDSTSNATDFFISRFHPFWLKYGELEDSACMEYTFNNKTYLNSGTYIDTIASINGCDSIITLELNIKNIEALVTQSGNQLQVLSIYEDYQWINCATGNPMLGDTNQSFTATQNGSYAVIVNQNGCSDTSECYAVTGLGINSLTSSNINIYPNPSNGTFTIDLGEEYAHTSVQLLNMNGQIMYQKSFQNNRTFQVDTNLPKGFYMIQLINDAGSVTKKLIIE